MKQIGKLIIQASGKLHRGMTELKSTQLSEELIWGLLGFVDTSHFLMLRLLNTKGVSDYVGVNL